MTELDICHIALVIVGGLTILLWALPGPCVCEKCAFHTNERRMKALRQAELNHDTEHKGFGWKPGAPDRIDCHDETCPRNRRHEDA